MDALFKTRLNEFFAAQPEIETAYVFGSVAAGRETDSSDLDIAIVATQSLDFQRYFGMIGALERLAGREVDLVQLERAPIELQYAVISQHRPVYERDRERRVDSESRTLSLYADALPRLRRQREQILKGPDREQCERRIGALAELYRRAGRGIDRAVAPRKGRVRQLCSAPRKLTVPAR